MTLGVSVLLSLIFALTIIPMLSQRFLSLEAFRHSSGKFIEPVNRSYERSVHWALRNRIWVVIVAVLTVGAGVFFYLNLD